MTRVVYHHNQKKTSVCLIGFYAVVALHSLRPIKTHPPNTSYAHPLAFFIAWCQDQVCGGSSVWWPSTARETRMPCAFNQYTGGAHHTPFKTTDHYRTRAETHRCSAIFPSNPAEPLLSEGIETLTVLCAAITFGWCIAFFV